MILLPKEEQIKIMVDENGIIKNTVNARSKNPESLIGRDAADFITCPKKVKEFKIRIKNALHSKTIALHFKVEVNYDGKREKRKCCIKKSTEEPSTALVNFYSCEDLN